MNRFLKLISAFIPSFLWACSPKEEAFVLVQGDESATILVSKSISEPLQLAVGDLVSDVKKITGKR